jgi:hypothetical protein
VRFAFHRSTLVNGRDSAGLTTNHRAVIESRMHAACTAPMGVAPWIPSRPTTGEMRPLS